jgi:membrane protein required for colicin V production
VTWLDYAVAGVLLFCVLWGIWRGLVREVVSVLGWVIAFLAGNLFAGPLGQALPSEIPTPELRLAVAFVAIIVLSLVVTTLLGLLLSKMVKAVGLESLDRTLGAFFGMAKGVLILVAVALLAGLTNAPRQGYWRDSIAGAPLARTALAFKPLLPPTFAERLRYD